ncbi:hypothetical protein H4S02_004805, partial [Coemansia sp. RSA 2611]
TALSSDFSQAFMAAASQAEPMASPPPRLPLPSPPRLPLPPCRTPVSAPRPQTTPAIRPLHLRPSTPLATPPARPASRSSDDVRRRRLQQRRLSAVDADGFPAVFGSAGHRRRRSAQHVVPDPELDALFDPAVDPPSSLDSPPTAAASPEPPKPHKAGTEPLTAATPLTAVEPLTTATPLTAVEPLTAATPLTAVEPPRKAKAASAEPLKTATPLTRAGWISMDRRPPRAKSLRESLRRLPGNRAPLRTGLASTRRKPGARRNLGLGDSAGPVALVTLSGLGAAEKAKAVAALAALALAPTEDPLRADVCVRHGRLGRTLKVLCALARGTPVVPVAWLLALDACDARPKSALVARAHAHVLADRATERAWRMTLRGTLRRAAGPAPPLLSAFCVLVADVARDPACLATLVRAAGGHVLNAPEDSAPEDSAAEDTAPALLAAGSSSPEPDDDDDADWSLAPQPRAPRAKRRKTLPRLKPADDCALRSEPSLILAPPTPSAHAAAAGRRRPGSALLDPASRPADFAAELDARKAALGVPAHAALLVVTDGGGGEWAAHAARLATPENVIQSIIHCALEF